MNYWLGTTIKIGTSYGLVCDYDQNRDEYTVALPDLGLPVVARRMDVERVDIPADRETATILRESNYMAGTAYLSEDGWDIVSVFDENDDRDLAHVDPSPPVDYGIPQDDLIWDPDSHTFVRREDTEPADRNNPKSWGLDPAMHTFRGKNPEFEGIYSNGPFNDPHYDEVTGSCRTCGAPVHRGDGHFCQECGGDITKVDPPSNAVQPHKDQTSTYLDVDPRATSGRDDSFPSMISKTTSAVTSMKKFTSYREELAWREANGPNLDECPECGDFMQDEPDHKQSRCHSCGHRQDIIYNVSNSGEKTAFIQALAPLAMRFAPLMLSAFSGGGGGGDGEEQSPEDAALGKQASDDVGMATDNSGHDVEPDAGNQGFTEDHGISPELEKDVNDIGGTQGAQVLAEIKRMFPKLKEYANDDSKNASEDEDMINLDDLLATHMPGYQKVHHHSSMSVEAARRPKMCPYHTNLVDYAIAMDDPALALKSLGGLMYSEQSCQGGYELLNKNENPIKCKYKPEMIRPEYWVKREQEQEQRRLEREQRLQQEQALLPPDNREIVQEEIQAVPTTDPLIQVEENKVTIPAETLEQLKEPVPEVDAIELPTDYDPEAYWEADDNDFGPPEVQQVQTEEPLASAVDQRQPVMANAPEAPAIDVDHAKTKAMENPQHNFETLRKHLLSEGMDEQRVENAINALMNDIHGVNPHVDTQQATFAKKAFRDADPSELLAPEQEAPKSMEPITQGDPETQQTTATSVTDADGEPLTPGATYDMFNDGIDKIPEKVRITRVDPYFVEFEVENDDFGLSFKNRVHAKTIETQGIRFQKHTGNPNADGHVVAEPQAADPSHYTGPGTDDLSTGRSAANDDKLAWLRDDNAVDEIVKEASTNPALDWLKEGGFGKEAGRHFTPGEQRALISEPGEARNLDKLDLQNTHYVEAASDETDDDSLLFF